VLRWRLRLSPDRRVRLALLVVGRRSRALQTAEEFLQVGHDGWSVVGSGGLWVLDGKGAQKAGGWFLELVDAVLGIVSDAKKGQDQTKAKEKEKD
jgi:hypothetical protein